MASSAPAGSSQAVAASSRSATGFRNVYVCRGATKRPFQATVFGEFVGSYSTAEAAAAAAARRHADVAEAKAAKVPATLAAAAIGAKWWSTGSARRSDVLSMTADAALAAARAEGLVLPDSSGGSGYIGVQRRQSKCGTRFEALWRTPDILRRRFGISHIISFGTWANAQQAAYVLARESKRIGEAPQPSVSAVNDTSAVRQGAKAARDRVNAEMAASAAQFKATPGSLEGDGQAEGGAICDICKDPLGSCGGFVAKLICGHCFCHDCLATEAKTRNRECPFCHHPGLQPDTTSPWHRFPSEPSRQQVVDLMLRPAAQRGTEFLDLLSVWKKSRGPPPVVVYPAAAAGGAIPGPGPVASADGIAASALLEFSAPR